MTVATRSPKIRAWSGLIPSTGHKGSLDESRERQFTTDVRASVCAGRLKGSPEVCKGNRRDRAVERERRNGPTLLDWNEIQRSVSMTGPSV